MRRSRLAGRARDGGRDGLGERFSRKPCWRRWGTGGWAARWNAWVRSRGVCLDLKSWRCRGNCRASVTQFRSRCYPIWICCCDTAVAEIMSRSMAPMSHTKLVTDATISSSTWPRDRCAANFAAESSFPGFRSTYIPPPPDRILVMDPSSSSSSSTATSTTRFRPYASPHHQVTKGRYITSNDPRGYMSASPHPCPVHAHPSAAPSTSTLSMVSGS